MRDKIEQIKQAVAVGQMPRAQGADMIGRIVQAEDPELFAGLSAQNAQNKMQQAAASQAGGDGMSFVGGRRATGQPGEVPFRSALRDPKFSFLNPSAPNPASGSMQVGLPSGVNPQDAQNIQNLGGGGGRPITAPGMANGEYYTGPPLPSKNAEVRMQQNVPRAGVMQGPEYMQPVMKHRQSEISKRGLLGLMGDQVGEAISPVTGALRSAGRSAGGYMKSLFNDPSRMALLQGGLSMMDPNTYYDKQGFGSVFTGLNKGLGAAQAGHAGVQARRKAVADRQKVEAEAAYASTGKGGTTTAEYERHVATLLDPTSTAEEKRYANSRVKSLTEGTNYNSRYKSDYLWKELMPKADDLEGSLVEFKNLMDSTMDSDIGMEFGFGTDMKANFYAFLEGSLGQKMDGDEGERLKNSKIYRAAMGKQVATAITAFGAGTGLSDADRTFAENMVGMKPEEFTEDSLRRLQVYNEGAMRGQLMRHNKRVKEMYGGNPPAGTLRQIPAMSKNLHRHMVEQMKKGGYKVNKKNVDPNQEPEGWVNEYPNQWKTLASQSSMKKAKSRITRNP